MLLFLGRSQKTKTRTQSLEHGAVATGKQGHLLGCLSIKRYVRFLGVPPHLDER